jgi:hypothetical protein
VPSKRPCLGEAHWRVSNTVFGRLVAARCGTGSARGPGVDSVYSTPRHGAAGPAVVTASQPPASPPAAVADRRRPGPRGGGAARSLVGVTRTTPPAIGAISYRSDDARRAIVARCCVFPVLCCTGGAVSTTGTVALVP